MIPTLFAINSVIKLYVLLILKEYLTTLNAASAYGMIECVSYLLDKGAEVDLESQVR